MSDLPQLKIDAKTFSAKAKREVPGRLEAEMRGNADVVVMVDIGQFLTGLHAEALKGKSGVVMDLRGLLFMNSSCFKNFVTWLNRVSELPQDQRYDITFLADPARHWQRRSLAALAGFGGDNVKVEPPLE